MSNESDDLERLIADAMEDLRDDQLADEQVLEIQKLLLRSPEARRIYLKHNQLSRILSAQERPAKMTDQAVQVGRAFNESGMNRQSKWRRMVTYAGWAAAASLLLALYATSRPEVPIANSGLGEKRVNETPTERPMAVLTRAIDLQWEHATRFQAEPGKPITERWLRVASGVAEVSFSSGATVSVEGPARLRLDNAMHVYSKSGKLTANCPPSAHGFTVRFRGGKVIDLGTEFALDSQPEGKTKVQVLNGEVIVALTDEKDNVLKEQNLKGNSAVELNPDESAISPIEFNAEPYSGFQRASLIRSEPIKLQFDLGHRAGLYSGTNSPAHSTGDVLAHEESWTQIVGDQSGTFVMADGNICPYPIRVDYGHGDGIIDWDAEPVDPSGSIYNKSVPFFNTPLCQDHRPWDFDLGLRVAGLPAGTYRVYALCRSIRRPTAAYDVSFGVNLDRQVETPLALPPMDDLENSKWEEGLTYAVDDVEVSSRDEWVTFITRYSRQRSLKTTPHHGSSVLLGLQIVEIRE